jgi:hypothetical protein
MKCLSEDEDMALSDSTRGTPGSNYRDERLPVCDETVHLILESRKAAEDYSSAVDELQFAIHSHGQSSFAARITESRRMAVEEADHALNRHVHEHGCLSSTREAYKPT